MQRNGGVQIGIVVQNLDAINTYDVATKAKEWEHNTHVNHISGYASHVTHIISWITMFKNNWMAEFIFDISVKI